MHVKRWMQTALSLVLGSMLVACGGSTGDGNVGVYTGSPAQVAGGAGGTGGAGGIAVDTADAANLKYAQESLSASTGTVKITFTNKGSMPHNWTLVKQGEEDAAITEANAAGAPNYTVASAIAQSKMLNGGETETFEFDIAEAGTYAYICTFPGHYVSGMKGVLNVAQGSGEAAPPATGGGAALTSNTGDGAAMAYAQTSLEASAGSVTLTFNNKGAMPHNWTLVKQGEEDAALASATSGPDYLAAGAIAQTKMANAGESDTITFTVEAGTYTFICTFPGHYISGMKGTLVVK